MNFERGRDPKDSMEIGLRANAKVIYAIFQKEAHRTEEGPLLEGVVRIRNENIHNILECFKDNPNIILNFQFDQIHPPHGLISGPHEFIYEMGGYVKYQDKYYHIPIAEWEKVMNNVVNA